MKYAWNACEEDLPCRLRLRFKSVHISLPEERVDERKQTKQAVFSLPAFNLSHCAPLVPFRSELKIASTPRPRTKATTTRTRFEHEIE